MSGPYTNQSETELYPEYAEYQKYIQFQPSSSSSLYNAFENAESADQYLDAPPSQKLSTSSPHYNVDISKTDYFIVSPQVNIHDPVALHFNVQASIADAKGFHVLSYQELEDLKKELMLVENRLTDVNHKLSMEVKLRDAALSISKLGNSTGSNQRKSFLFNSSSSKDKKRLSKQADDEVEISNSKINSLKNQSLELTQTENEINSKILKHHVAILALTHPGSESSSANIFSSTNKQQPTSPTTTKTATSRMLLNQRTSNSFPSPPQSPYSNAENSIKIDKIISILNNTISSQTTSPRQPVEDEKLDFIYDLCCRLVDQLNHSKTTLKLTQEQNENFSNLLSELLHSLDQSRRIHPSQYKNFDDLRITALQTLHEFQGQYDDKLKESENNHNQLKESNQQLQNDLKSLQHSHDNLKKNISETKRSDTAIVIPEITSTEHDSDQPAPNSPSTKVKSLLRQQVESLTTSYETNRAELERLELENVDLKTNIQETKFSSQAEIQQLKNELTANEERVQEWKERCDALHSELESVVRSLEEVTRQAVDYESERSKLERTVHDLENKLFQASNSSLDKRVSMIGGGGDDTNNSISNSPAKRSLLRISTVPEGASSASNEPVSVSVLRHEFRKITQEMNSKHMKEIKQLQSEKKKLEHLLRSIKTSSYMGNISSEQIQSLGVIEAN